MVEKVVVSGMGIVSAIGQSIADFGLSLEQGKCGIDNVAAMNDELASSMGAVIRNFSFSDSVNLFSTRAPELTDIGRRCTNRTPANVQTSTIAVMQAWLDARLDEKSCPSDRISIIVAGSNLADKQQYDLVERFNKAPEYIPPSFAFQFMDTNLVGVLSEVFGIHGEGFTVGGASASGGAALVKAGQMIKYGLADICVVVGAHADLSPVTLQAFINIGAMVGTGFIGDPKKACRPFDLAHAGFIYGQGSGCIILESLDSARRRGVNPLAEITSGAIGLDGNRLSNPSVEGEARIMSEALRQAGLSPSNIDYLNTHGSASPLGDKTEIDAIKRVFKENLSDMWVNSTKALTGHCLFSAGIVEVIGTIIQMEKGFVHPNINLDNPIDTSCRFSGKTAEKINVEMAMSNSFGFGGINTSIVIGKIAA